MSKDIFDPARFTTCSVRCVQNNASSIQNNEAGRFQKVLNKVSQFDPTSKYLSKGRELLKISNKIYDSKIIPRSFADGITGVIDHYAVKPFLDITEGINAEMAGLTKRKLGDISTQLRAGNLKLKDVEDIADNLSRLTKYAQNIFSSTPNPEDVACLCDDVFNPAKYIADHYFPKYSSWFCVEFEYTYGFSKNIGNDLPVFAFLCTKASRPSVKFEIEEINKYGQRIFVQKRSEYEPLDLTFIDDDKNVTHTNFQTLLSLLIPNMNLGDNPQLKDVMAYRVRTENPLETDYDQAINQNALTSLKLSDILKSGNTESVQPSLPVSDTKNTQGFEVYAGSIAPYYAPYGTDKGFYIKNINVYQVYRWGKVVNKFIYRNPIMASCAFSEIDASGESESSISSSFRYGALSIDTFDLTSDVADKFARLSVGAEGSEITTQFTKDGSLKSPKIQLGPTNSRLAKYGAPHSGKPGFLDKLKVATKQFIQKQASILKAALKKFGKALLSGTGINLGTIKTNILTSIGLPPERINRIEDATAKFIKDPFGITSKITAFANTAVLKNIESPTGLPNNTAIRPNGALLNPDEVYLNRNKATGTDADGNTTNLNDIL